MDLFLYNSLHRAKEKFIPLKQGRAGMYTCGMTVYDFAHIGHGRKYVGDDIIRRVLEYAGYSVTHVQNVTDVGHLVSDEDEGEDKMEKGALKHGKTVWEVAEYFTDHFYSSMDALGILRPTVICKATEHIQDQINLIERLFEKGAAYDTPEAVYFDIEKFPAYGELFGGQSLEDKKTAVREEVQTGSYKKNPADFALWFKRVGHFENHAMHWPSPWGDGFPGWHIECSAMSMKYLGETFDIHTGGIDHIPVHHPNEIAQSEAATGKPFAHYWIHHAFLTVDGKKMSKSLGNYFTIEQVIERGYDPMALRYFYLSAHYRQQLNFTWEALDGAHQAYKNVKREMLRLVGSGSNSKHLGEKEAKEIIQEWTKIFEDAVLDDLNMPKALAALWGLIGEMTSYTGKEDMQLERQALLKMDTVFGFGLSRIQAHILSEDVLELIKKRDVARASKDWTASDALRDELQAKGYEVQDTPEGTHVTPL